jgi:DNA-binding response OmpR family regulator
MEKVLLVEDSPEVKIVVQASLKDFEVHSCSRIQEAEQELKKNKFSLLILDIELPDGDGVSFFSQLQSRVEFSSLPTFFLTGKKDLSQKLAAFSLGADDFITKPFEPAELRARVQARLKKSRVQSPTELNIGNLTLLKDQMKVIISLSDEKIVVPLTLLEFKILQLLLKSPDRIYERDVIIDEVWGKGVSLVDRTVDAHVSHLRKKISKSNLHIDAIPGVGYKASLQL